MKTRNQTRVFFSEHFHIPYSRLRNLMPRALEQLQNCKSEEAQRLLLGVTRKEKRWRKPNAKPSTNKPMTTGKKSSRPNTSLRTPDGRFAPKRISTQETTNRGGTNRNAA